MVLGIGAALAREGREGRGLRHSLVLLFFTGEEQGLLGSDYFVTAISSPGLGGRSIVSPGSSISTATRRRPVPGRGAWRERKEARWWSWCAAKRSGRGGR